MTDERLQAILSAIQGLTNQNVSAVNLRFEVLGTTVDFPNVVPVLDIKFKE